MPLGVGSHEILLGSQRIPTIDPQSNARTNRLEGAIQKQHWVWNLVGSYDPLGSCWDPTHMSMQEAV